MLEFTGERLIPAQADPDLWNEHYARYLFASRLASRKRVLDIACGAGYGSACLSRTAASVTAIDLAPDAAAARHSYPAPSINFLAADACRLPFPDFSFDLIVAFEVIEHLHKPDELLTEARRLLAPGGQFVVSTPNRLYYTETRKLAGPNPFHVHEFDFDEFRAALNAVFPSVSLFLQNHAASLVIRPALAPLTHGELRVEPAESEPHNSHFFIAACASVTQTGSPTFVYLPATANVLREREHHIQKLEAELAQKTAWLDNLKTEHATLVDLYRAQSENLKAVQAWGLDMDQRVKTAETAVIEELARHQDNVTEIASGYESQLASLQAEHAAASAAAEANINRLESALTETRAELTRCVDLLHESEKTVEERTLWAQNLQARIEHLESTLASLQQSRWLRFGRKIGVGPDISQY
ncbi:MAG: methyltransferase domain-containing protein [Bryobacteraceae bacterium]|nr:methyltransferase domain-containing protein [Bryobacteraceae bacterium]